MKFRHRYHMPSGSLSLHIRKLNDSYFIAEMDQATGGSAGPDARSDYSGAVLYVVAVVFIWGFSIVLLIASYVRKNRMDNNISLYLKEIQTVQRRTRKEKILRFISMLQSTRGGAGSSGGASPVPGTGGLNASQKLSMRRVSSHSSSLSYGFCRSRSASPTPIASSREGGGSLQLLAQPKIQDTRCKPYDGCSSPLPLPPAPPLPPRQPESGKLAAAGSVKVKRHSYGCFLPEIFIESDVDLAGADQSSISDVDEIVFVNSCSRDPDGNPPEAPSGQSNRNRMSTDL